MVRFKTCAVNHKDGENLDNFIYPHNFNGYKYLKKLCFLHFCKVS